MKSVATFAGVFLACVPAMAQFGGLGGMGRPAQPQAQNIELELLDMEQDADKTALKEAFLLQARQGMQPAPEDEFRKRALEERSVLLRDFIARKKDAITARSAELADKRTASRRLPAAARARPPLDADRQAAIEKYEKAKVEAELLQAQVALLEADLKEAVQTLAKAELAASFDESERPKADAARKAYEKIKGMVVEYNKRLRLEQQAMQSMQMMGFGGMGGGFQ